MKEVRWNTSGGAAVQTFFIDHRGSVIAQGWLLAVATALSFVSMSIRIVTVLPRWTAWLAVMAGTVNLLGTTRVFFRTGVLSIEGNVLTTWLPVLFTAIWYLGVSVAPLRARTDVDQGSGVATDHPPDALENRVWASETSPRHVTAPRSVGGAILSLGLHWCTKVSPVWRALPGRTRRPAI